MLLGSFSHEKYFEAKFTVWLSFEYQQSLEFDQFVTVSTAEVRIKGLISKSHVHACCVSGVSKQFNS